MSDPLMRSGTIEIGDIFFELPMELTFIQNEDVIQALAANTVLFSILATRPIYPKS